MYSKYLGKTLRERVAELEPTRQEALALTEELIIMRAVAVDALQAYERASEQAATLAPDVQARIMMAASSLVVEAMNQVRDMAMAAHRISEKTQLDANAMQSVVLQVVKVVDNMLVHHTPEFEAAGVDPRSFADAVADALASQVRLPKGFDGTDLTPDQDMVAMNASVPAIAQESA